MAVTNVNSESSNGTLTHTQAAGPGVTWNLTYILVSFKGPSRGPNARLTVYDGTTSGTVIFRVFLDQPTTSIGFVQEIAMPMTSDGKRALQGTPGNAMTVVVDGFGANACSLNMRFTDGLS